MANKLKDWKIGIAYERYGYINVKAETKKEAIEIANKQLKEMTGDELEDITEYIPDSETVDEEFVEEIKFVEKLIVS